MLRGTTCGVEGGDAQREVKRGEEEGRERRKYIEFTLLPAIFIPQSVVRVQSIGPVSSAMDVSKGDVREY